MSTNPRPRAITARLDALESRLRAEIANLRADLIDRIETRFSQLDGKINALAQEFKQFKGTVYGFGITMTVLIPFVTWALNKFLK